MEIRYDKLKRFAEEAQGYILNERGNEVELIFYTPSLGEAAGVGSGGEGRQIVLRGVREGDYVRFTYAAVKDGEALHPLSLKDLELWINFIESFY